jgi:hypothetical protein
MLQTKSDLEQKRIVPAGVIFISFLLLIYGILGVIGCFLIRGDKWLPYYVIKSVLFIITAILTLINHKWALYFAFLSATFLTIDGALQYSLLSDDFRLSIPATAQVVRFFINSALNWTAYIWYRKWRTSPSEIT